MLVYAVDVGTTNVKVVLYDDGLRRLATASAAAEYDREGDRVEFDPSRLFDIVVGLIGDCARTYGDVTGHEAVIVVTGQAESLILVDRHGDPVRPGMSWLDDRATAEVDELAANFDPDDAFATTGEPSPSATWPAAKLRWLAKHEPATLESTRWVLMVKDELVRRFTGTAFGEETTRGFTYLWDVRNRRYWDDMLDFCSVPVDTLAPVVPAGTEVGRVTEDARRRLPDALDYHVNVGALDHFCAMVGTGSYRPNSVSESAGTVLSLSMLASDWTFSPKRKVSFHAGLRLDDVVLFNGIDAGGAALDWYRREGLDNLAYDALERELTSRNHRDAPIFLPYLTGVNPPDYYSDAKGAFLELTLGHDRFDMAFAVEEGVAHLLRRNIDDLAFGSVREIVSTGGGASSPFWTQLKADVCGVDVLVPAEQEATCRGAAVLALVARGVLGGLEDANDLARPPISRFAATPSTVRRVRYHRFCNYLDRLFGGPAMEVS
ncbi:FGGY family carbohydrate kinase [Gordonia sp. CPCC 205515]|uniref:FGGY-family carbohydrate kinase n=1 Tax=Gordonia sp. CPCC 205515 TaxID=3140791 RepID=UPI003AF3D1D9